MQERIRNPVLLDRLRVIREEDAQPRVAKFDVVLRQAPLRAVHVMHTILTRMVMFHCVICNTWCWQGNAGWDAKLRPGMWTSREASPFFKQILHAICWCLSAESQSILWRRTWEWRVKIREENEKQRLSIIMFEQSCVQIGAHTHKLAQKHDQT